MEILNFLKLLQLKWRFSILLALTRDEAKRKNMIFMRNAIVFLPFILSGLEKVCLKSEDYPLVLVIKEQRPLVLANLCMVSQKSIVCLLTFCSSIRNNGLENSNGIRVTLLPSKCVINCHSQISWPAVCRQWKVMRLPNLHKTMPTRQYMKK